MQSDVTDKNQGVDGVTAVPAGMALTVGVDAP